MFRSTGLVVLLGGLIAVAGCERDKTRERSTMEQEPGKTTVTGANVSLTGPAAVSSIVEARCAREAACNNIGVDKGYGNHDACMSSIKAGMKDDLNADECPRGVDRKKLDECLSAIRAEGCNNPIDKIGRLVACRTSDLCIASEMPNR